MIRRKKNIEESENHERWLVSYADFITLLFAFFVVMYSISSVNEGKYRVLSDALEGAFSSTHSFAITNDGVVPEKSVKIGNIPTTIEPIQLDVFNTELHARNEKLSSEMLQEARRLLQVSEQFETVLEPYIEKDLVEIKRHDLWVELEMKSKMLFSSGEAELASKAKPVLKKIAEIVRQTNNVVQIEGHTDDMPIDTVEFPSNWDLSSARAASVVKEFVQLGINPARLAAVGYGEFHPVADNELENGRFKNRRVVLVLLASSLARYKIKNNERELLLKSKNSNS